MDREARLLNAIEAYKNGGFKSIRGVAAAHDVDHMTLTRRLAGAQPAQNANAPKQALSPGEEEGLVNWLQRQQERGFPIRHDMLKAMAEYLIAV